MWFYGRMCHQNYTTNHPHMYTTTIPAKHSHPKYKDQSVSIMAVNLTCFGVINYGKIAWFLLVINTFNATQPTPSYIAYSLVMNIMQGNDWVHDDYNAVSKIQDINCMYGVLSYIYIIWHGLAMPQ